VLLAGCLTPNSNEKISEDLTGAAVRDQQTGPPVGAYGQGSANYIGDKALEALVQSRLAELGINSGVKASKIIKNVTAWVWYGVGALLILAAVVGFTIWYRQSGVQAGVARATAAAVSAARSAVDNARAVLAKANTPETVASAQRHLLDALEVTDRVANGH